MYAVYGLDEEGKAVEKFLGYIPAEFFSEFVEPEIWVVKAVQFDNGKMKIGRVYGRAFFTPATSVKADRKEIEKYMGTPPAEHRG